MLTVYSCQNLLLLSCGRKYSPRIIDVGPPCDRCLQFKCAMLSCPTDLISLTIKQLPTCFQHKEVAFQSVLETHELVSFENGVTFTNTRSIQYASVKLAAYSEYNTHLSPMDAGTPSYMHMLGINFVTCIQLQLHEPPRPQLSRKSTCVFSMQSVRIFE